MIQCSLILIRIMTTTKVIEHSQVNSRIHYIDVFRGLLMLMVVLGHSIGNTTDPVNRFILSFHMPAFFLLSGMCFKPKTNDYHISQALKRKSRSLLWPYLTLSLVGVALYWVLLDGTSKGQNITFGQTLVGIVWPDGNAGRIVTKGFWFVYDLIWITVLYVLTRSINKFIRLAVVVAAFLTLYYGNVEFYFSSLIMRVSVGFMFFMFGDLCSIYMRKVKMLVIDDVAFGGGKMRRIFMCVVGLLLTYRNYESL